MPAQGNAVVLTALGLEYDAIREFLEGIHPVSPVSGTQYETGTITGKEWSWQVTIARIGEGNTNAAVHCERVIRAFHPHVVLFVGVAGSLRRDSVRLGDVVVASRVAVYQGGKDGDRFRARAQTFECSHVMGQVAGKLSQRAHRGQWLRRLGVVPDPVPEVHLKPIATGDVVIDGEDGWARRLIEEHYNDAVAVEMESAGLLLAAHANGDLSAGVIRGISDLTVGKHQADSAGWQDRAARHAAGFGVELLAQLDPRQIPTWRDQAQWDHQRRHEEAARHPSGSSVNISGASIRYASGDYTEQTINYNYNGGSSGRP
jgi:adenosylhomocysteine nucleosidase